LVRPTLAIYITLFAVAVMAIAQIVYWKLVINREAAPGDAAPKGPAMDWALEPIDPRDGFAADTAEPLLVSEPAVVSEPVLFGA
jgi:hypothetical protein